MLVVVVRPTSDDVKVLSGGGTGVLRAAVSVAVAAGTTASGVMLPTATPPVDRWASCPR
ncbi:MAG: hypothetical protein R2697_17010 [Ilumatobacteraceae bacterium]